MLIKYCIESNIFEIETNKDVYLCVRTIDDCTYNIFNSDAKLLGQVQYLPNIQAFISNYEGGN